MITLNQFSNFANNSYAAGLGGVNLNITRNRDNVLKIETSPQSFKGMLIRALSHIPVIKDLEFIKQHQKILSAENYNSLFSFLSALMKEYDNTEALFNIVFENHKYDSAGNKPLNSREIKQIIADIDRCVKNGEIKLKVLTDNNGASTIEPTPAHTNKQPPIPEGSIEKLVGFTNLRNTCYANSVLKMMIHSLGKDLLIKKLNECIDNSKNKDSAEATAAKKFITLIRASHTAKHPLKNEILDFLKSLQITKEFSAKDGDKYQFETIGVQNDPRDFLESLCSTFGISKIEGASMELRTVLIRNDQPPKPHEINIKIATQSKTDYLFRATTNRSDYSLQQVFDTTHQEETIEKNVADKDGNVLHTQHKQWVVPNINDLQRFSLDINTLQYRENTFEAYKVEFTNTDFTQNVNAVVYDTSTQKYWGVTLEPREIVVHQGSSSGGHYVCYTKESDSTWSRHDDEVVSADNGIKHNAQAKLINFAVIKKEEIPAHVVDTFQATYNPTATH